MRPTARKRPAPRARRSRPRGRRTPRPSRARTRVRLLPRRKTTKPPREWISDNTNSADRVSSKSVTRRFLVFFLLNKTHNRATRRARPRYRFGIPLNFQSGRTEWSRRVTIDRSKRTRAVPGFPGHSRKVRTRDDLPRRLAKNAAGTRDSTRRVRPAPRRPRWPRAPKQ